ncbi:transglutaminase family protein [Tepidimonas charontis]|uniref:Transglutaminase-like domain-containing protein n=1 Tax=Tepidimonas charontis TaxID=2267262 RepID=A0A554X6F7_9BURK|nr:transglutaminase family protein [Tepidimonas charontis]TSE31397.1 hypothetical protein Tchar_02300 [Tepidimonas charontis]
MLLCIRHHTHYRYERPVVRSHHLARLRPHDGAGQSVLAWRLTVRPTPAWRSDEVDPWHNRCTRFDFDQPHQTLDVWADALVQTTVPAADADDDAAWEQVRAALPFFPGASDGGAPTLGPWVQASTYIPPAALRSSALRQYAQACFAPGTGWLQGCRELARRIHHDWTYTPGATRVDSSVLHVLRERRGVCQDFSHLMIAALRSLGLPARYVSGYVLTQPPPGQARRVGTDASHAWVAVPSRAGWYHLDPTHARWGLQRPSEAHVVLAHGRDYADAAPLGGVLHGGGRHAPVVAVTIAPADEWAALGLHPPWPPSGLSAASGADYNAAPSSFAPDQP